MVGFESVQFWNVENGSIDEAGVSIKMMHVRPLARIHIWKSVLDVVLLENLANVECIWLMLVVGQHILRTDN